MQRAKNAIYELVSRLSRMGKAEIRPRTLLIIKTDEIGDYVLWRNVLPCIRNSALYRDYKITLLGNSAWKNLATSFDAAYVDEFIWLDKKRFKSKMGYRYKFLRNVSKRGFEKVVNVIFSRSPRVDDAIAAVCVSSQKTGMLRNEHNVAAFEKGYDKMLYQEIQQLPLTGLFEFERNKKFTSLLLKEDCEPSFGFNVRNSPRYPGLPDSYAVLFPGSGRADRRWKSENFAAVANHLQKEKNTAVVLAGGPGDKNASSAVAALLDFPIIDITGQTSLSEFVAVLSNAKLLVSVDTGAVHLAAAAGCPVYGLFDGSQYGRFAPYPANIPKKPFLAIYPDAFEKELSSPGNVFEKYQYFSPYKFDLINVEKVISKIDQ